MQQGVEQGFSGRSKSGDTYPPRAALDLGQAREKAGTFSTSAKSSRTNGRIIAYPVYRKVLLTIETQRHREEDTFLTTTNTESTGKGNQGLCALCGEKISVRCVSVVMDSFQP